MKKLATIFLMLTLCISLIACDKQNSTQPLVNNPPQSEQLSYTTNKDGYITSCKLTISGETYAYECQGDNYLLIEDDYSVISEFKPSDKYWSGTTVKVTYFYENTAKIFVIKHFGIDENFDNFCERVQIYNLAGEVVVDKTPRPDVEEFYFGLGCDLQNLPLWTASGEPATDADGNYLLDQGAIAINDHCYQKADHGVIICGNLMSTTHYDTETGNVVYSRIYDPLSFGYVTSVFDRTNFNLTYKETLGLNTLTKQWYNSDGSYFEKVTDIYEQEIISEGNYTADGALAN